MSFVDNPEASTPFDIPILCYHYVESAGEVPPPYGLPITLFEQHLDFLADHGFKTISFSALYKTLQAGTHPPRKSVIITFDDGSKCFHQRALPALVSRNMQATMFIVAGEIGGINRWDIARGASERSLMNEAEIKDLIHQKIEIGSHGWSHRAIPECSESELEREIRQSKQELESRFGQLITTFAYPYGRYRESDHQALKQAGYSGAVSIFSPYPTVLSNRFAMRRIGIHSGDTPLRLRMKLAPLYLKWAAFRDRKGRRDL